MLVKPLPRPILAGDGCEGRASAPGSRNPPLTVHSTSQILRGCSPCHPRTPALMIEIHQLRNTHSQLACSAITKQKSGPSSEGPLLMSGVYVLVQRMASSVSASKMCISLRSMANFTVVCSEIGTLASMFAMRLCSPVNM